MEGSIIDSIDLDHPKKWICAYNPALINVSFGPTSGVIYLIPFEVSGIHDFRPGFLRFKFYWQPGVGSGPAYGFIFYNALYRMERGTGGTAATFVKQFDIGTVAKLAPAVETTEYVNMNTANPATQALKEGLYAIAMLWRDTSLPGSSVVFTAYGTTLPSGNGWWYHADGGGATSLPATIAAVGSATTFQLYFECS